MSGSTSVLDTSTIQTLQRMVAWYQQGCLHRSLVAIIDNLANAMVGDGAMVDEGGPIDKGIGVTSQRNF